MNVTENNNIAFKAICLKLNSLWKPVGVGLVSKTICDLMTGVIVALDISYHVRDNGEIDFETPEYINPVDWDKWVKLPIRSWDFAIHSCNMSIRVPTVVIAKNYSKSHKKSFENSPTKEGLFIRDNATDAYTGLELDYAEASIDHVLPLSRGGTDTYDNAVLTTKEINNRKGNRLNSETGLKLLINPHQPAPIPVHKTIKRARHADWKSFLDRSK